MAQRNGEFSWANILSHYPTAASIKKQVKSLITTKAEARIRFGPTDIDILAGRTPPIYRHRPELWFSQVEAQLQLCYGAASEDTLFNFVVAIMDVETAALAEAIILKPPQENKYKKLKSRLVGILKQKLLENLPPLVTTGKKPSDILNELRQITGEDVPEGVLQEHWFKQLPRPVQDVVMTDADLPLEAIVEIANKVYEVMFLQPTPSSKFQLKLEAQEEPVVEPKVEPKVEPQIEPIVDAKEESQVEQKERPQPSHLAEFRSLHQKVEVIEQQMAELQKKETVREKQREEKVKKEEEKVICWYHKTHKVWANKCEPPCNFYAEYIEPLNRARFIRTNPQQTIAHKPEPTQHLQNSQAKIQQPSPYRPSAQISEPTPNLFIESITRNIHNPENEISLPPPYWSVAQNSKNAQSRGILQPPRKPSQNSLQQDASHHFWSRIYSYVEDRPNVAGYNTNLAGNVLSRLDHILGGPPAYH